MRKRSRIYAGEDLRCRFLDPQGNPYTPSAPALTIEDGAGNEVEGAVLTVEGTEVVARVTLPGLDVYRLTWTATAGGKQQTIVETATLAGMPYFELSELRAWDATADLNDATDEKLKRARIEAEDVIEQNAGVAFVPRGRRVVKTGDGTTRLILPDVRCRRVLAVTVDGSPVDTSTLHLSEWGALDNPQGWTQGVDVLVHYEHGHSEPPEAIVTAALMLATHKAIQSGVPSRALSQNTELGFIRFAIAGRDGATGIPDVDAAIEQFGRNGLVVG